jgi:DNA-binding NarL/FixJ family response regulator
VTETVIRVALADDDVLLREGLASLLEQSGFVVAGQCGDGSQLIALVREKRPELAIVDIRMPPDHVTEGLDAARVIRAEFPDIAILVLSAHVEVEHAMDLLTSGERSGYLLKSRVMDVDDFIDTLKRIVRGGSVVDPVLVQALIAARKVDEPLEALSPREREVLSLMALRALARRSAVPVQLDVRVQARLPERAEVAAYFVVSEALANVAKHAHASMVQVRVEVMDDILTVSVRDDGIGGADPSRGSGLIGLSDRVEASGGTISISSRADAGTRITVELPVAGS